MTEANHLLLARCIGGRLIVGGRLVIGRRLVISGRQFEVIGLALVLQRGGGHTATAAEALATEHLQNQSA